MKELGIRRMRNLSFTFLFATAWLTAGEPLRASLSNCDTLYNSYSQALGSGSCHKSGNGWAGVYYCTFPDNEYPDDPFTQGTYFGDLMWGTCVDDAESQRDEFLTATNIPGYCVASVVYFTTGVSGSEAFADCAPTLYVWCVE